MGDLFVNAHLDRLYEHPLIPEGHLNSVILATIDRAAKCTQPELCDLADRLNMSPCRHELEPLVIALLHMTGRTVRVDESLLEASRDIEEDIRRKRSLHMVGGFTPPSEISIISHAYFD